MTAPDNRSMADKLFTAKWELEDRAREAELLLLHVALRLGLPAAGTTAEQTKRLIESWLAEGSSR